MRTITFYSYKGGVGRSLLVANAAKYLSTLGKSVFALDLDLEAPGLHYKFELGSDSSRSEAAPGVVDTLSNFLKDHSLPTSIENYTTSVKVPEGKGPIHIMRAGLAPQGDYWRQLSKINWYDILYGPEPLGAPFFLELKERIRTEYKPDFLLIDSRTGITEMGGIATTLLPDTVVCLALSSLEHLEGMRAVMQGISQTATRDRKEIKLLAAISRLPIRREEDDQGELANILAYLNSPIKSGLPGLELEEIFSLHSEPLLDMGEQLLIGGKNSPHELPLLRDYLRLFSKIIPAEDIRPYVGQLIQQATSRLLDDPDTAQSDLEALTAYCADPEAYRALIKLYHVRKTSLDKILATGELMWRFSSASEKPDHLVADLVYTAYTDIRGTELQKKYVEFAETIWRQSDGKDVRVCVNIANAYLPEKRGRAVKLLLDYLENSDSPSADAVVKVIDLLRIDSLPIAQKVIARYKGSVVVPEFHVAWAKTVFRQSNPEEAKRLLADPAFRADAVRVTDPALLYRLLTLAGDESADDVLRAALESAAIAENMTHLRALGQIFYDEGNLDELEFILGKWMRSNAVQEILADVRKRARRGRMHLPMEQRVVLREG